MTHRVAGVFDGHPKRLDRFTARLDGAYERLFRLMHELYGWRWDFAWQLESLVAVMARAAADRAGWLRGRDRDRWSAGWMEDPATVWVTAYTERFARSITRLDERIDHLRSLGATHLHLMPPYAVPEDGDDGGYAVESYRRVRPELGTIDDLAVLARSLDRHGMTLVLDFVANHTAGTHDWARAALAGEPPYDRFYRIFDSRADVEEWLPHLREIFPSRGGDAFTPHRAPDGREVWVWTTFYDFQWDLDYSNPEVLVAMVGELLHLANLGAGVIRMDATPFLWKAPGTSCENLPEAHVLLQIMNTVASVVAPSVRFLSEAIVHPDDVSRFVRPDECATGYNPALMSALWEAVATRHVRLLEETLAHRQALPGGAAWINYLRSHDDIGWGFADEDVATLGTDPADHRRFLNEFYAGRFPGTFSRGGVFQENSRTGDARVCGTLASLAGLESAVESADANQIDLAVRRILAMETVVFTAGGMPLIFAGDEIGMLNDHRYAEDPAHAHDNRWMHRPRFDWRRLANAEAEPSSPEGRILAGFRRLAAFRRGHPSLASGRRDAVETGAGSVLGYTVRSDGDRVLVLVNLADTAATARLVTDDAWWLESGGSLRSTVELAPYGVVLAHGNPPVTPETGVGDPPARDG
jgi:amylosucrase